MHGTYRFSVSGKGDAQAVHFQQMLTSDDEPGSSASRLSAFGHSWRERLTAKPTLMIATCTIALSAMAALAFYNNDAPTSNLAAANRATDIAAPAQAAASPPSEIAISPFDAALAPRIASPSISSGQAPAPQTPPKTTSQPVLRFALPEVTLLPSITSAPSSQAPTWRNRKQAATLNPRTLVPAEIAAPIRIILDDVRISRPPLPALINAPRIIAVNSAPQANPRAAMLTKIEPGLPEPPLRPEQQKPELLATRETSGRPIAASKPASAPAIETLNSAAPARPLDRRVDMDQISTARPKQAALEPQLQATPMGRTKQPSLASAIDAMQIGTPALPNLSGEMRADMLSDAPTMLTLRRDGVSIGQISVRMTSNSQFEVQLSGLLSLAAGELAMEDFDRLRSSDAAQKFVPLDHLRDLGIELNYDPVYDEIRLNG